MSVKTNRTAYLQLVKVISAFLLLLIPVIALFSQDIYRSFDQVKVYREMRRYDSVIASRVPVMKLPEEYRNRALPVSVDNSKNIFFPGILNQEQFFTCQQYAGVAYTYAYERNRLMKRQGNLPENRFAPHYTWCFMNNADRYTGVSFFYSYQVLKEQGHMTNDDYGDDTATGVLGWISGYDKYYRGMTNRIKGVYSIPVNTAEGVLTLKNYLHDHLDGSSTGGVACFSASSNFLSINVGIIPAGTPEAGKEIITAFYPNATHGMTIVGYNDSIRYDLNGDGKYTNNIDITGDGIVDVKDWELGAYRMANSYGISWHDQGYSYIMYRAMALDYDYNNGNWTGDRGVWNGCVYIVESDTSYHPLLTMKVKLTHDSRQQLRIRAGVSEDTSSEFPEHVMDFPIFSFEGGDHWMTGKDGYPGAATIETGFDITPLLGYVVPGQDARFFLEVEERDTSQSGAGTIDECSFIDYTNGIHEIMVPQQNVPINDNSATFLSATGSVSYDKVQITTGHLPPCTPGNPYQTQLAASGGRPPYQWSLVRGYEKKKADAVFPAVDQERLLQDAAYIPYTKVSMPFSFPFYGKNYDTIWVNFYGFITFDKEQQPYPYITDEEAMMRRKALIAPAFCMNAEYPNDSYGVWMESSDENVTIRWVTGNSMSYGKRNNFVLRLWPSGEFEFIYGDFALDHTGYNIYSGYSCGDEKNFDILANWNLSSLSGKSWHFGLKSMPDGISLTKEGLLSIPVPDQEQIYDIPLRVTDANGIRDEKTLGFSSGLTINQEVACDGQQLLKFGFPARLKLTLRNDGNADLKDVRLSLASSDTSEVISDSVFTVSSIAAGSETVTGNIFSFELLHPLQDMIPVDFTLTASSGSHKWKKAFTIPVSAPDLSVTSLKILDGVDGMLDPGEVAYLVINVQNNGSLYADDVEATISASDTLVNILSEPLQTVDRVNASSCADLRFLLRASRYARSGHVAEIMLNLTNHGTIDITVPFNLVMGKMPVAIVNLSTIQSSADAMKVALDSLQVPYSFLSTLPSRTDYYNSLFVLLGTTSGSHALSTEESGLLSNYLAGGGRLYLESFATWYYQNKTPLHPYFKYTTKNIHAYPYYSMLGATGTFAGSMYFDYASSTHYASFSFVPQSPAFELFATTDSVPHTVQIAYDGSDYKTIGSLVEFGSLVEGQAPSDKLTLMQRYLDFFEAAPAGPKAFFHCDRNSVCRWDTVRFTDDSYDNITSWHWEFPGGTPATSQERNPSVSYVDAGDYDVKLHVSDGTYTRSIIKEKFVSVNLCTGMQDLVIGHKLIIFPNPVTSRIWIKVPVQVDHGAIEIYDLAGRKIRSREIGEIIPGGLIMVDISMLSKGIYIVKLVSGTTVLSAKMVIS